MDAISGESPRRDGCVFLDATPLADPCLTGIGRYTARIALAMRRRVGLRFFTANEEILPPADLEWRHDQDLQGWARRLWRGARRPIDQDLSTCVGIYPCLRPKERRFGTEVVVLHDFTPLVVPGTHTASTIEWFQNLFADTLLESDGALAVSHATKHDASWLCDFPQDRIRVCHSGPSLCVERHLWAKVPERRKHVALVVGTLEPRKNADFLLEWFTRSAAVADGSELWWVGRVGWLTTSRRYRRFLGSRARRVRLLGTVSDGSLCRLYREASVSIYPSLYEGFGFPVVDSLRHGTPVLMGYHSSLREFEELRGVHYFDPCDAATVDAAWSRFQDSPRDVEGPERLNSRFDWDRVAASLVDTGEGPFRALGMRDRRLAARVA